MASAVENALAAYSGTTAAPHEYFDHTRVSYRCLKETDGGAFCHLAAAVDDMAVEDLKQKPFFKPYSIRLRAVAKAGPHFTKLQVVGGTEVQL